MEKWWYWCIDKVSSVGLAPSDLDDSTGFFCLVNFEDALAQFRWEQREECKSFS
jgi:hypothetical protein